LTFTRRCEVIAITQYLRASKRHHPVQRSVSPEEFVELREEAAEIDVVGVWSGPLCGRRAGPAGCTTWRVSDATNRPPRPGIRTRAAYPSDPV
jgi:hypothetical protein